jgi:hypothetical protein
MKPPEPLLGGDALVAGTDRDITLRCPLSGLIGRYARTPFLAFKNPTGLRRHHDGEEESPLLKMKSFWNKSKGF